jgi:Rrf2 family protein
MLSNRTKYATRALLDLSLRYTDGPIQICEIAARQDIPLKFLEQILLALKQLGFVKSRKGPGGGYVLAHPPESITLGSVVRALEGPLAPISCASVSGYMECGCPDPAVCGLRVVWRQARDALAGVLDNTTFADICTRHLRLSGARENVVDYEI